MRRKQRDDRLQPRREHGIITVVCGRCGGDQEKQERSFPAESIPQDKREADKQLKVLKGILDQLYENQGQLDTAKVNIKDLLKKMVGVKIPGWEQFVYLGDPGPLTRTLKFWLTLSKLQRLRRTGWVRCGVREPETVAGHMFRMAFMGFLINGVEAAVISLCHDAAECIIGDITPHDNVTEQDKATREDKAFRDLVKEMPGHVIGNIYQSFRRYEDQLPGDLPAQLTKDLDKFDMILQAWEYEKRDKKGRYLEQFFESAMTKFKTVPVIKGHKELLVIRENHFAES